MGLTDDNRRALLRLARASVEAAARGVSHRPEEPEDPALRAKCGAFVTLKTRGGRLRGCIGAIEAYAPLYRTVAEMAVSASQRDPRFPPVETAELADLLIEISVLTPPRPISADEVEVGRHGLIVASGRARGLLLPQVPVEQGWDRKTFLAHTCLKAGLPSDAWKAAGTELRAFTAEVFGECEGADESVAPREGL